MKPRILVVEDNLANLDLMIYLLRSFGYEVESRTDGLRGLDAAKNGSFGLVIADVLMPGIDGYEFARRFKADPSICSIPLVAVTALAMPSDRKRMAAAGFDGSIQKPIEPRTFVAQIEAFLPGTAV